MSEPLSTFTRPMEQQALTDSGRPEHSFVRDLDDGQAVEGVYLVRGLEQRRKRNGDPFLKLELGDSTGTLEAMIWDDVEHALEIARQGSAVCVSGQFEIHPQYGAKLTVRALRAAESTEFDPADLADGPLVSVEQLERDLDELIATVQDAGLRGLLERLLGEGTEVGARFRSAPAAKYYHQAYRHGLLEHCLSVAQGVSLLAATFPGIDRDVAVAGGLLHDIGKTEAYEFVGDAIDLTDAGKLLGEIPLGYHLVRREIELSGGVRPDAQQALLHIILSHHGQLEHGSPVVPATREATLVHMIDNLGGRLGSFDRIEKGLAGGERWSGFDRALSGSAYFGSREPSAEREAA